MKRYGDLDELEEIFREVIAVIAKKPEITKDMEHLIRASATVIEIIKDQPTVDVVEVVRCKDCKHLSKDEIAPEFYRICRQYGVGKSDNGFCDEWERSDDVGKSDTDSNR